MEFLVVGTCPAYGEIGGVLGLTGPLSPLRDYYLVKLEGKRNRELVIVTGSPVGLWKREFKNRPICQSALVY
jgi:hypothetical protein